MLAFWVLGNCWVGPGVLVQMGGTRKDIGCLVVFGFLGKLGGLLGPYIERIPNKSKLRLLRA